MKKTSIIKRLVASVLLMSMVLTSCSAPGTSGEGSNLGEQSGTEGAIRLQDDFYNAVNAEWLANTEIPSDKPMVQPMMQLQQNVSDQIRTDMDAMLQKRPEDIAPEISEFLNLYEMLSDTENRDKEGFSNLLPYLEKVAKIKNMEEFNAILPELILDGFYLPFQFMVHGDMANSEVNMLYVDSPSTLLPSSYYETEMAAGLLSELQNMLIKYLIAMDYTEAEAAKIAEETLLFDAKLPPLMKTPEELSVMTGLYNPIPFSEFAAKSTNLDFGAIVKAISGTDVDEISLVNPRYYDEFENIVSEENLPMIKSWMIAKIALNYSEYLPKVFQEISFEYDKLLSGVAEMGAEEEQIYNAASSLFAQPIGLYYGQTYFGEEAKQEVEEMVAKFILIYKEKIENADWLSAETKEMAILKLDNLYVGIGYPEKIESYFSQIKITGYAEGGSIVKNMQSYNTLVMTDHYGKIGEPTDREIWSLSADVVNANAVAMKNAIYFPAAILQAPFYSMDQSASANYGGIGVVIAHEISHVFDSNGAMYDEKGNLSNWWTEEDFAAFGEKIAAMTAQFDGLPYAEGNISGALSVSENMADNAGMSCALGVLESLEDKNYEEFFTTWAKSWSMKASPEIEVMLRDNDVHAPNIYRVNILLSNFPEFYEAFGVKEDDDMYLEESKRIIIW